jgi:hypothetical protein
MGFERLRSSLVALLMGGFAHGLCPILSAERKDEDGSPKERETDDAETNKEAMKSW